MKLKDLMMYVTFSRISVSVQLETAKQRLLPVCLTFLHDGNSMEGKGFKGKNENWLQ